MGLKYRCQREGVFARREIFARILNHSGRKTPGVLVFRKKNSGSFGFQEEKFLGILFPGIFFPGIFIPRKIFSRSFIPQEKKLREKIFLGTFFPGVMFLGGIGI